MAKPQTKTTPLKIALLCGGPSLERGISLNSARSVLDHLQSEHIEISPIYFDQKKNAFTLSPAQLYSNTPADFDFKLNDTALSLSEEQLEKELSNADIVFPVIHGNFGEDGTIQKWMEDRNIAYVGSNSSACKLAFDKYKANEYIKSKGFFTLPSCVLKIYKDTENEKIIKDFFKKHSLNRAIVKPATGGSSIGVFSVSTANEAIEKTELIFSKRMDTRVVIEPFAKGREFTVIILENRYGLPVAILPTEIEADYTQHQIFDYRKKYLPSRQVTYHCPPRFDDNIIERIQNQAEQLFVTFKMNDFARFDGWVLDDGSIWFSDFNPISGMEQNSFLFQQSSRAGLSHSAVLEHIVARACERQKIKSNLKYDNNKDTNDGRIELPILMGGSSSERQVSLMSGTNVWLKLRNSKTYRPVPYLVDLEGGLWQVPYQLLLNHTVEEIIDNCRTANLHRQRVDTLETRARERLGFYEPAQKTEFGMPELTTIENLIENHNRIFIALHGDFGEDGRIQKLLESKNIHFNGPGEEASILGMDKQKTQDTVLDISIPGILPIPGITISLKELSQRSIKDSESLWQELLDHTSSKNIIAKPSADGCSSGVIRLSNSSELARYISLLEQNASHIPAKTFSGQTERIELPLQAPDSIRFEKLMATDNIKIKAGQLKHTKKTNLVEITIGVIEQNGKLHAFNPSITVAEGEVLSVEEKFQGGTGINLTPPPKTIMSNKICNQTRKKIEILATKLNMKGYCRIDAFVNCDNGEIHIIEINTLPALTPSTVLFQQGMADEHRIYPLELLELLASNK